MKLREMWTGDERRRRALETCAIVIYMKYNQLTKLLFFLQALVKLHPRKKNKKTIKLKKHIKFLFIVYLYGKKESKRGLMENSSRLKMMEKQNFDISF